MGWVGVWGRVVCGGVGHNWWGMLGMGRVG